MIHDIGLFVNITVIHSVSLYRVIITLMQHTHRNGRQGIFTNVIYLQRKENEKLQRDNTKLISVHGFSNSKFILDIFRTNT